MLTCACGASCDTLPCVTRTGMEFAGEVLAEFFGLNQSKYVGVVSLPEPNLGEGTRLTVCVCVCVCGSPAGISGSSTKCAGRKKSASSWNWRTVNVVSWLAKHSSLLWVPLLLHPRRSPMPALCQMSGPTRSLVCRGVHVGQLLRLLLRLPCPGCVPRIE